ncbi:MAG: PfkB family carbohydrate kinase [Gemmatimonadota bacterium]|nr:PfkB family carbohydrate kinase [Gemmatimonadota bacterium]
MILALGTVTLDRVEDANGAVREGPGGSAPYFAAAATRHHDVRVVGVVGPDYPRAPLDRLQALGVDLGGIRSSAEPSQRWHARYDRDGNRTTLSSDRRILEGFRPDLTDEEKAAQALFLGSIDPAVQGHVLRQWLPVLRGPYDRGSVPPPAPRDRVRVVALDSMSHWIGSRRDDLVTLLPHLTVLFGTSDELLELGDRASIEDAVAALLDLGPDLIVEKRGRAGARAYAWPTPDIAATERARGMQPPRERRILTWTATTTPISAPDPTGAGDAFCGGFFGKWVECQPLRSEPGHSPGLDSQLLQVCLVAGVEAGTRAASVPSWETLR